MSRSVAFIPDKYVGLDLNLIEYIETSAIYTFGVMRRIGDEIGDEVVGIEAEVEVDIGGWEMQWPKDLITPDEELKLDK